MGEGAQGGRAKEGKLSKKYKSALLLVAIFLLTLPLLATANSTTLQSVADYLEESFTPNPAAPALQSASGVLDYTIAMGGGHALVLDSENRLWVWGNNWHGQLGLGNWLDQNTPQLIAPPAGAAYWTSVYAGTWHTLAFDDLGRLWSWGENRWGQLGIGSWDDQNTPQLVNPPAGATSWASAHVGCWHNLVFDDLGRLWVWGRNFRGELGIGLAFDQEQNTPQLLNPPAGASSWDRVLLGESEYADSSYAYDDLGRLWVWGRNERGQLGIGNIGTFRNTPVLLEPPAPATAWGDMWVGQSATFAYDDLGRLWAWGRNGSGELGIGTTNWSQITPALVTVAPDLGAHWVSFHSAFQHTTAFDSLGRMWVWGASHMGQIGLGTDDWIPAPQILPPPAGATAWHSAYKSDQLVFAVDDAGRIWAWGDDWSGQLAKGVYEGGQGNGDTITDGTNNWLPWRLAASLIPRSGTDWTSPNNATIPNNLATAVSLSTDTITIRFDREMCTKPESLGTIVLNNGATVDVSQGVWSNGTTPQQPDDTTRTLPNAVFTAPLSLLAPNTLHTATVSQFVDVFGEAVFGSRPASEMHPYTWTFTTETALAVSGVTPAGHQVSVDEENLVITFDRAVNTSVIGTVVFEGMVLTFGFGDWSNGNTVLTIPLPGLEPATSYTVEIEGFAPLVGAAMQQAYVHRFVTEPEGFDLAIRKDLLMPEGTAVPNTDFTFDISAYSYNGDTTAPEMADVPNLNLNPIAFGSSDTGTVDGDTITITHLSDFLLGSDLPFPFAGLYVYRISERDDTFTNTDTETMLFDPTVYQITFQVENLPEPAPANSLFVRAIFLQRVINGVPGEKIDITDSLTDALLFTNVFVRNHDNEDPLDPAVLGGLRISKEVEGAMANQTRFFDFDLSVQVPSLLTTLTGYRAYVVETIAGVPTVVTTSDNGYISGTSDNGAYLFFSSNTTQTVSLRHGQALVFAGTHVGARYSVTEQATANYTPSVAVLTGGLPVTVAPADTPNTALTVPVQILGEATNSAAFTNTHSALIEAGLDVGNFGMALLLAAVAALVVMTSAIRCGRRDIRLKALTH